MTNTIRQNSFSLHIEGGTQNADAVPAAVLVQILENAQRAFELIGVHVEGRTIKERAAIPAATRKRFQLVCRLPKPGCYAVPIEVGGHDLLAVEVEKGFAIFKNLIEGITGRDSGRIKSALPDERLRHRVLEAIRGMAPRADAKWRLKLWDAADVVFGDLDTESEPFIRESIVPIEEREASQVVTGQPANIDFLKRTVTIFYPPTRRMMDCVYDDAVEELLFENRRGLIQVTGRVVLDENGAPTKIIDVNDIRELDLSPLVVDTIKAGGVTLRTQRVIALEPTIDETQQLLCVVDTGLGIDAFARTREALVGELHEQIGMLWQEYALANDATLDVEAVKMKQALRAAFSEVADAA